MTELIQNDNSHLTSVTLNFKIDLAIPNEKLSQPANFKVDVKPIPMIKNPVHSSPNDGRCKLPKHESKLNTVIDNSTSGEPNEESKKIDLIKDEPKMNKTYGLNLNPEKKSPKIDDQKLHGNNDKSNLLQNKKIPESKHEDESKQKIPIINQDEDEAAYYACLNRFTENKEKKKYQRYLANS